MTIPLLGDRQILTDQGFVSEKHLRIAQIINEFDPDLFLVWVPPAKRQPGDAPFAVVHRPLGREEYVVLYADECDERILHRIIRIDGEKHNVQQEMELNNLVAMEQEKKKKQEVLGEANDVTAHILASPKSSYTAEGIKYHTHQPSERVTKGRMVL